MVVLNRVQDYSIDAGMTVNRGRRDSARAPAVAESVLRWWARRVVIGLVVAMQLSAIVAAYGSPHKVFGWQMFNASSDWQAEIVRVESDRSRHNIGEQWPGDYEWGQLVFGRGLESPFYRQHAQGGLDTTFSLFQAALDWVADNTLGDDRTVRIEAVVTFWVNGRDPVQRMFVSPDRVEASQ